MAEGRRKVWEREVERSFKHLHTVIEKTHWELWKRVNDVDVFAGEYGNPTSSYKIFKGTAHIPGASPVELMNAMMALDSADKVKTFDSAVDIYETIETVSEDLKIDYVRAKLPWPLSDRDMIYTVARRVYSADETTEEQTPLKKGLRPIHPRDRSNFETDILHIPTERCYVWATSVTHPSRPPISKVIRLHVSIGCLLFEPISPEYTIFNSPGAKVTRMVHGDPKGQIPAMIVNHQSLNQITGMLWWLEQSTKQSQKPKLKARL